MGYSTCNSSGGGAKVSIKYNRLHVNSAYETKIYKHSKHTDYRLLNVHAERSAEDDLTLNHRHGYFLD